MIRENDERVKDIRRFLKKCPEFSIYEEKLFDLYKQDNFNLFFSKLKKSYFINKTDKSFINELLTAHNLKFVCGFHPIFMPEKDLDSLDKLKQGSYMIFEMPDGVLTKDLAKIKTPDLLIFFKGKHFYVEIKTINKEIKLVKQLLKKIDSAILQIETFGKGLIQLFCEKISDEFIKNYSDYEVAIIKKLVSNKNIMGVIITYYDLISYDKISENQEKRTYKKINKFISNENFIP